MWGVGVTVALNSRQIQYLDQYKRNKIKLDSESFTHKLSRVFRFSSPATVPSSGVDASVPSR
jgi:hypothetical protein